MNGRPQCGHTISSSSSAAVTRRNAAWQWGQTSRIICRAEFGGLAFESRQEDWFSATQKGRAFRSLNP